MATFFYWTSDVEHLGLLNKEEIVGLSPRLITPVLEVDSEQFQPASLDLRIGAIIVSGGLYLTTTSSNQTVSVPPGGIVTILTREELHMPTDVAGFMYPMNRYARLGLLTLNHGHIDPGYKGVLSVKIVNMQNHEIPMNINDPICTVVFERILNTNPVHDDHNYRSPENTLRQAQREVADTSAINLAAISVEEVRRLLPISSIETRLNTIEQSINREEEIFDRIRLQLIAWIVGATISLIIIFGGIPSLIAYLHANLHWP